MTQLAQPNLSAVGRVGYCLEYQARLWGTTHTEPYAWNAWMNTRLPRTDTPPTDLCYPLWFSYFVNGFNEGHVVTFVPGQGYYSSPWQLGTFHAVLPSIAEVERIYGVKYVGWSEDILEKQVIGEAMEPIFNEGDRININFWLYGEDRLLYPTVLGMKYKDAIGAIFTSKEYKANQVPTDYTPYTGPTLFIKK